ncbi:hypothetical protein Anapl_11682 [Anas platyrhynchos]|uniref:Uncharacterized protein n=1 Tax=Anas platyrhynchos TaxID=8839 RepID=R0L8Y6_ANAPL|nr:hypothetical protein Anapl_11682 [Anas platyrhynchos]
MHGEKSHNKTVPTVKGADTVPVGSREQDRTPACKNNKMIRISLVLLDVTLRNVTPNIKCCGKEQSQFRRLRALIQHLRIKPLRTKLQEEVGTEGSPPKLASKHRAAIFKTLTYNISAARKELQSCLIVQVWAAVVEKQPLFYSRTSNNEAVDLCLLLRIQKALQSLLDEFQHPDQVQGGNKLFQKFTNLPLSSLSLAVAQRNLMDHLSLLSSQPPHATIDKTSICEAALGEIFLVVSPRKHPSDSSAESICSLSVGEKEY